MADFHQKDWVNHIIIAFGVLIGIWIFFGMLSQIRYFTKSGSQSNEISKCNNCITLQDNNYQQTLPVGSEFVVELPQASYPQENVSILQNPANSIQNLGTRSARTRGHWAVGLRAIQKGYIDIVVKSSDPTTPDFHTVVVIE
jgi:hypothetical protein